MLLKGVFIVLVNESIIIRILCAMVLIVKKYLPRKAVGFIFFLQPDTIKIEQRSKRENFPLKQCKVIFHVNSLATLFLL